MFYYILQEKIKNVKISLFIYEGMHMEEIRKIIHIDMDAFYASIEQETIKT